MSPEVALPANNHKSAGCPPPSGIHARPFRLTLRSRQGVVYLLFALALVVGLATRVALLFKSAGDVTWDSSVFAAFGWGALFDLASAFCWSAPLAVALAALPARIFEHRFARVLAHLLVFSGIYLLFFGAVAEWFFWDEFGARFNFIAVDYLVYTTEVIGNISESYPMPLILGTLFAGALGVHITHALRTADPGPLAGEATEQRASLHSRLGLSEQRVRDRIPLRWLTVFVIVADHCASSAGKAELPVENYHIPMLIYSPGGQIPPGTVNTLMSQVDYAPTLLGLLKWSYASRFLGCDVLRPGVEPASRALIGNYQQLGLLRGERLGVLKPIRQTASYRYEKSTHRVERAPQDGDLIDETIAY